MDIKEEKYGQPVFKQSMRWIEREDYVRERFRERLRIDT